MGTHPISLTWRDHGYIGSGGRELRQLGDVERASACRQSTLRVRSWHAISSVRVMGRPACGTGLADNLLGHTTRTWNLCIQSQQCSRTDRSRGGQGGLPRSVDEGYYPHPSLSDPTESASLLRRLTFLSHLAFALAQWTQAMGIRSVGESIMDHRWRVVVGIVTKGYSVWSGHIRLALWFFSQQCRR